MHGTRDLAVKTVAIVLAIVCQQLEAAKLLTISGFQCYHIDFIKVNLNHS